MMRRWVGLAVVAGCLGLAQTGRAQFQPAPGGPAMLPEPVSFGPGADSSPNLTPGPLNSMTAPVGPGPDLSLPPDGTGAFPCKETQAESGWFFHIGGEALRRQGLAGHGVLAVEDVNNLDTTNAAVSDGTVLQSLSDLNPRFGGGIRGTVGYLCESQAFELTAFYIFQSNRTAAVTDPGRIDSLFFNTPLGFEGDNGLWLQADRFTTTFSSTLYGAEANYRRAAPGLSEAEFIFGLRYLDLHEKLTNVTDDDGVQFPLTNGAPDPTRVATYFVGTRNRLVAPQLGFEWNHPCCGWLNVGLGGKGAWGADFVDLQRSLIRGDGFVGFDGHRNAIQFGQAYEINAFLDFHLLDRAKLRVGYDAMWLLETVNVVDQFDFNLQNTNNFDSRSGSTFFHGPMAELEFLF